MTGIDGSPPDLRHVPSGCPFHPRCRWAMEECVTTVPPDLQLHDIGGSREVLCWLQDGEHEVPPELNATPPAEGTVAARPSMRAHGTPVHANAAGSTGSTVRDQGGRTR
jgi:peptide/nickel transport system ATP-binding protein